MSPDSEDWFGHVREIKRLAKYKKTRYQSTAEERWSDQIRRDTGLRLLTTERYAMKTVGWRDTTSRRTNRGILNPMPLRLNHVSLSFVNIYSTCTLYNFLLRQSQ